MAVEWLLLFCLAALQVTAQTQRIETSGPDVILGSYVVALTKNAARQDVEQLQSAIDVLCSSGERRRRLLLQPGSADSAGSQGSKAEALPQTFVVDIPPLSVLPNTFTLFSYAGSLATTDDPFLSYLREATDPSALVIEPNRFVSLQGTSTQHSANGHRRSRRLQQQNAPDSAGCPVVAGYTLYSTSNSQGRMAAQSVNSDAYLQQLAVACTNLPEGCIAFDTAGSVKTKFRASEVSAQAQPYSEDQSCIGTYVWTQAVTASVLSSWQVYNLLYEAFFDSATFNRARLLCGSKATSENPDLLSILSEGEWGFVTTQLIATYDPGDSSAVNVWLGATSRAGGWINIDGSPMNMSHWAPGQPQPGLQCAVLRICNSTVQLYSANCNDR